jgi:hypothetical protein
MVDSLFLKRDRLIILFADVLKRWLKKRKEKGELLLRIISEKKYMKIGEYIRDQHDNVSGGESFIHKMSTFLRTQTYPLHTLFGCGSAYSISCVENYSEYVYTYALFYRVLLFDISLTLYNFSLQHINHKH